MSTLLLSVWRTQLLLIVLALAELTTRTHVKSMPASYYLNELRFFAYIGYW